MNPCMHVDMSLCVCAASWLMQDKQVADLLRKRAIAGLRMNQEEDRKESARRLKRDKEEHTKQEQHLQGVDRDRKAVQDNIRQQQKQLDEVAVKQEQTVKEQRVKATREDGEKAEGLKKIERRNKAEMQAAEVSNKKDIAERVCC